MGSENRFQRWIVGSISTQLFNEYMPVVVQGLGRVDQLLVVGDEQFLRLGEEQQITEIAVNDLNFRITLSYLWILGAWEVVRTMSDSCGCEEVSLSTEASAHLKELKKELRRIRVPLAKMKPANGYKSDSRFAMPILNSKFGIGWQVSEDKFFIRRELSDRFLRFLEALRSPG